MGIDLKEKTFPHQKFYFQNFHNIHFFLAKTKHRIM